NAETHADVIEEDITRFHDGFTNIDGSMRTFAIDPTLKLPAVEGAITGTIGGKAFWRIVIFQHGSSGNDFENGAGRELCLNNAIEQRMQRIFVELAPFFFRNANREIVGVGSWPTDHCQHFAGAWIKGHDSSWSHAE